MKKLVKISSLLVALSFLPVPPLAAASNEERDYQIARRLTGANIERFKNLAEVYSTKDTKMNCYNLLEDGTKVLAAFVAATSGVISLATAGEESTYQYVAGGIAFGSTILSLLTVLFGKKYTYYQSDETREPLNTLIDNEYTTLKGVLLLADEPELLFKRRIEKVLGKRADGNVLAPPPARSPAVASAEAASDSAAAAATASSVVTVNSSE